MANSRLWSTSHPCSGLALQFVLSTLIIIRKLLLSSLDVLCVKSRETNLLSRCTVVKDVQDGRVKVRLLDMGSTEDHPRSKLFQVPEIARDVPYMAFHCTLFEQKVRGSFYALEMSFFVAFSAQKPLCMSFSCQIRLISRIFYRFEQLKTIIEGKSLKSSHFLSFFERVGPDFS